MVLEDKIGVGSNVYMDIRLLHNHLGATGEYEKLKSDEDFTAVAISSVPDVKGLEFLIKKFTRIYFNKRVLHSRKAHQLMFEYSVYGINNDLRDVFQIREFMLQIEVCTSGKIRGTKFDLESILYPNGFIYVGERMRVFPSNKQLELLKDIQQGLGLRTEGVAALISVIWTVNATFKNVDMAYEKGEDLALLVMTKEWWGNDENSIKQQIIRYAEQYISENIIRLKKSYDVLKIELQMFNKNRETVLDSKKFECVKVILERIENSGILLLSIYQDNDKIK
jgi:hypothetical protein